MRMLLTVALIGLVSALLTDGPVVSQEKLGASDLFGRDLKGWTNLGAGKSPWSFSTDRVLVCEKATAKYAADRELGNGTLHIEWRFRVDPDKKVYKASVSVRNSPGASGCKVALGQECGSITASFVANSDRQKTVEEKAPKDHARPIGDWNTLDLKLEGRTVTAYVNGKMTTSFSQCDTELGYAALEAEGSAIEFRHVTWK